MTFVVAFERERKVRKGRLESISSEVLGGARCALQGVDSMRVPDGCGYGDRSEKGHGFLGIIADRSATCIVTTSSRRMNAPPAMAETVLRMQKVLMLKFIMS
jgi:hypothetical protein